MGMSIDDAVESIAELDKAYRSFSNNEYQALNVAAETMRKYEKIEDIYYHQTGRALEDSLRSVIEDGKID